MPKKVTLSKEVFPGYFSNEPEYEINEILLSNGSYFFYQEVLMTLKSDIYSLLYEVKISARGRIREIYIANGDKIKMGQLLFDVEYEDEITNFESLSFEYNKQKLNDSEVTLLIDDFTKEKSIFFNKLAGQKDERFFKTCSENDYGLWSFQITFENNNGFVYIRFLSTSKNFPISRNDSIILLFDEDVTINYSFTNSSNKLNGVYMNFKPLTTYDIKIFTSLNFKKLKLINNKIGLQSVYHISINRFINSSENDSLRYFESSNFWFKSQYRSEAEAQYLLKKMVACFIKAHIDNDLFLQIN